MKQIKSNKKMFIITNAIYLIKNKIMKMYSYLFILFSISEYKPNSIEYICSIKGGFQLCLDGFPFTRHRLRDDTTYWRCVQFRPLGLVY